MAIRQLKIETRFRQQETLLHTQRSILLHPLPLLDRDHNGGLDAAAGDDLRALLEGSVKKLAEPSFRVLDRP